MDCRTYCRAWTLWVCLLATALVRPIFAVEPDATPVDFHIAGGDATTTLTDFSRQARLQLLFDYNVVKGHITKPLDGVFTPAEALQQLLANSDLDFDFVNERTLAVMRKKLPPETRTAADTKPAKRTSRTAKNNRYGSDSQAGAEEVIRITGTYLRHQPPVGEELISLSREDIDLTGAANAADFLRTLPQAFGGGPNQDTHIGPEALSNSGLGVGVNLRGLGARATLVLIDGRRVAPTGTDGEFVDIENIPLSAVERVDILPDSASAMYGADAVGGVVNFVLRDKFDGAETILRGGSGTGGDLQEYLASQTIGTSWDGGHGLIAFEYYNRGALPASHRAYATSDLQPFGGGDFSTNMSNPGTLIDPVTGQTYAIPHGQNGMHLAAANLVAGTQNITDAYLDRDIIPTQERWTLYGSMRQALGESFSLFSDVLVGHRETIQSSSGVATEFPVPSTNPFFVNPTGATTPVLVAYNFLDDLGPREQHTGIDTLNATVGLDFDAGNSWNVRSYGSYVREKQNSVEGGEVNSSALSLALADPDPLTAFNPFGDGSNSSAAALAAIGTAYSFWLNSQIKTVDIAADGPLGKVAGIPLKLAVGADWRDEQFSTSLLTPGTPGAENDDHNASRRVTSAFGQLVAPIVTEQDAVPAVNKLVFSAAGRYENFTSFGSATTPKLSLIWSPLKGLALRGTWSHSLRPPSLVDLDAIHNASVIIPVPNPAAPGTATTGLFWTGGNANLRPERATSWTTGLDFTPDLVPELSLGLTYFRTTFKDRIQATTYTPAILNDPAYSAVVIHNPSAAQISNVCNNSVFVQGTAAQCAAMPVGLLVDLRERNLGVLLTDGIDLNANYALTTATGQLKFTLNGTWLRNFSEAQTPDQPLTSLLNTENEPTNLRLRASTAWRYRDWSTLLAANFTNGYRDTASIPARHVVSWTTFDSQIRYDFPDEVNRWLRGMSVELNARNVFNKDPPFLNNQVTLIGYDQENADPYGRLLSLQLRKRW
jgi:outer membrane receptor protein involved in Fe transport